MTNMQNTLNDAIASNVPFIEQVVRTFVEQNEAAYQSIARNVGTILPGGKVLKSLDELAFGKVGIFAGVIYCHTNAGIEVYDPVMVNSHAQLTARLLGVQVSTLEEEGERFAYGVILADENDIDSDIKYAAICPSEGDADDEAFTIITLAIGLQIYKES